MIVLDLTYVTFVGLISRLQSNLIPTDWKAVKKMNHVFMLSEYEAIPNLAQ